MITTTEDSVIMPQARFLDIAWAIMQLMVKRTKLRHNMMAKIIIRPVFEDAKQLMESRKRVRLQEMKPKAQSQSVSSDGAGG